MIEKNIVYGIQAELITWIIPVYNGQRYIEQSVRSILNQPCKDLVVWVIDDGSTDLTKRIVKSIDDNRVRYVYKENAGVSAARNYGVKCSNSKYIAFLDADDILCRNVYDEKVHKLLSGYEYDILSFAYFNGDQNLRRGNLYETENPGEIPCDELKIDCFKHVSSFIFLRNLFEGENPLTFPEGIKCREDVTFLFLALCRGKRVMNIGRELFIYRNNSSSVLHRFTSYDYLIKDAVPSWEWCKKQCSIKEDINECDARLFADAVDYIQNSCMRGVPIEEIQTKLQHPAIKESVRNYEVLWKNRKVIYEEFKKDPNKYWKKMKRRGYIRRIMKTINRFPVIRGCYFRIKYKIDIRSYV